VRETHGGFRTSRWARVLRRVRSADRRRAWFDATRLEWPARTVIVNEAFARAYSRETGARRRWRPLRYPADRTAPARARQADSAGFEIVGVVRDFDLNPDDSGDEQPFVFHTASAEPPIRS
jgi:hypothetical protein